VEVERDAKGKPVGARLRSDGQPVAFGGVEKMSKSKNNGVDPEELIKFYGADTARFFMMFASPPEDTLVWSDAGVEGAARFLRRLWTFAWEFGKSGTASSDSLQGAALSKELAGARREVHVVLKQANYDISRHQFNTVASAAMKILNALERAPGNDPARGAVLHEGLSILLRLLSPITPHVSHCLWRELKFGEDVLTAPWPEPDPAALIEDEIELVVQVNGKKRGDVRVPRDADKATIEQFVLALPFVEKIIAGLPVKKIIIVPGRLVNLVV
jgi:leucyl-tRNA synthetase